MTKQTKHDGHRITLALRQMSDCYIDEEDEFAHLETVNTFVSV